MKKGVLKMDEEQIKEILDEFKKADGGKRLDMWDVACAHQVLWDNIITEMQKIAREQGVDKKLDKMMQEEIKKAEQEIKT